MHRDNVMLCFEANKAVLCEKALTLNAQDAAELVEAARARRLFFMEAMWMRCNPNIVAMQRLTASGAIGAVSAVGADFGFLSDKPPEHRLLDPALGASALLDIGVYAMTFVWLFMGAPLRVQSTGTLSERGFDLSCASVLTYGVGPGVRRREPRPHRRRSAVPRAVALQRDSQRRNHVARAASRRRRLCSRDRRGAAVPAIRCHGVQRRTTRRHGGHLGSPRPDASTDRLNAAGRRPVVSRSAGA